MSNARALVDLKVSSRGVNVVREGFRNFDKQMLLAVRRAVWQTSRRIKKEIDSSFIRVSHLKATVIRDRLFLKFKSTKSADGYFSSVWIGLNPISLSKLNPVKQAGGVKAGPIFVPDGFMPGGKFKDTVFTRRYETQKFPWDKQFFHFDAEMMQEISNTVAPKIREIFDDQFQKEVYGLFYEQAQKSKQRARERAIQL